MRRIALPLAENKLSPHFGNCSHFVIFNTEDHNIIDHAIIQAPVHQPGLLPNWLASQRVTDVIVNGIGHKAIEIFNRHKINVFVGAKLKTPAELVDDYLKGILETNGNLCNH